MKSIFQVKGAKLHFLGNSRKRSAVDAINDVLAGTLLGETTTLNFITTASASEQGCSTVEDYKVYVMNDYMGVYHIRKSNG